MTGIWIMITTLGAVLFVVAFALISQVTDQPSANTLVGVTVETVELPDGRTVLCVFGDGKDYAHGGASCDWENAK